MNLVEKLNFIGINIDDLKMNSSNFSENDMYNIGRVRGMLDLIIEQITREEENKKDEAKEKTPESSDEFWKLKPINELVMYEGQEYKLYDENRNVKANCSLSRSGVCHYDSLVDEKKYLLSTWDQFIYIIKQQENITQFCRVV